MTDVTPQLTLAGQSWPVSFFVLGEQKTIVPAIYTAQAELRAKGITTEYYDLLFELLTFVIKRAQPDFDRVKLESLSSGLPELQAAFLVICQQAGMAMSGEAKSVLEPPDWDAIIAHVCASTGWTWDYAEWHVTMPRLAALNKYWADHPPMHLMVAAYLGIKPKNKLAEPPPPLPDMEE